MNAWQLLNYGAWAASGLIFFWLIRDFLKTNKDYPEEVLLGTYEEEKVEISEEGGHRA